MCCCESDELRVARDSLDDGSVLLHQRNEEAGIFPKQERNWNDQKCFSKIKNNMERSFDQNNDRKNRFLGIFERHYYRVKIRRYRKKHWAEILKLLKTNC